MTNKESFHLEEVDTASPCVYILASQGLYKIGRTTNLKKRIPSLRETDFPGGVKGFGPIENIFFIKTDQPETLEKQLHALLEEERVTGEWFHLKSSDLEALYDTFEGYSSELIHESETLTIRTYHEDEPEEEEEPSFWTF